MSGLPPGIRPPESELQRFLRRNGITPEEAYQLGRDAAQRECHCGVRRGAETDLLMNLGYTYGTAVLAAAPYSREITRVY